MFNLSGQNYDITDELKVRQKLQMQTGYKWLIDKNDDPYDYDLKAWRYHIEKDGYYEKLFMGFIEIEIGVGWNQHEWPAYYPEVSFLKRKIYKFHYPSKTWTGIKDNADKTFYLKFNANLTNCFCQLISEVASTGTLSKRSASINNDTKSIYNHSFIAMKKNDVVWGINESIDFIKNVFNHRKTSTQDATFTSMELPF